MNALSDILGRERIAFVSEYAIGQEISEFLGQLSGNPVNIEAWISLAAYIKTHPPDPAQRAHLAEVLLSLPFGSLVDPTFDQLQLISMFLFGQALHYRDDVEFSRWEAKLVDLAEVLLDTSRRFPLEGGALLLGNCAFLLAHSASDASDAATQFSRVTANIAARWPAAAGPLLQPTVRVLLRQPSVVHAGTWRGVTELRCAAEKLRPLSKTSSNALLTST
jgi:hypothetical protein